MILPAGNRPKHHWKIMNPTSRPNTGVISPTIQIFAAIALLILIPFVIFGVPGYYGDDLHLLGALGKHGFWGAMRQWFEHYGLGYRPIGILLDYLLYGLIGDNPVVAYVANAVIFFAIALAVFGAVKRVVGDEMMALFVASFYALFPFGSTAYLQLSSFCMLVAILMVVALIGGLLTSSRWYTSWLGAWGVAVIWVAVLLTYEQPAGLYAFLGIALLVRLHAGAGLFQSKAVVRLGTAMTIGTVLFLSLYLMHPGNPKIVSLEKIVSQSAAASDAPGRPVQALEELAPVVSAGAEPPEQTRGGKLLRFFSENVAYALRNLISEPLGVLAFSCSFGLIVHGLFRVRVRAISHKLAVGCVLFGALWAFLSILPFFLYGRFTAPPYVFTLPSIGMGITAYGLIWAVLPSTLGLSFRANLLRLLFGGTVVLFALQQYGYFFGLNDELRYYRSLAERITPVKEKLLRGVVLAVEGVPVRPNGHIFWLEKAVGNRALISALGDDFAGVETRQKAPDILEIYIPNITSISTGRSSVTY
jgi:hypothetical protein